MPPLMKGGRPAADVDVAEDEAPKVELRNAPEPEAEKPKAVAETRAVTQSIVISEPIRSGQSVIFPEGDVTVIGSVASGAEVIAGGSIHIYGTLRGRAMAGSLGNAQARIFCTKLEAELIAIDGIYKMAEDMDQDFGGRPVQLWLEGDIIMAETLI